MRNRRSTLPGTSAGQSGDRPRISLRSVVLALAFFMAPLGALANETPPADAALTPAGTRNGREIYERFRDGLAEPNCRTDASPRWKAHFAHAPGQLAAGNADVLPLFGYVVDALREANLPTEFALIPFVESGYKPGARSPQGPAGLWQMIAITARDHKVPMRPGYDGRLSPVDSTTAAVRYLKTLHGMFAGDWRLAVMAYNAGEYRVLGSLKRAGQVARDARPETLPGLSPITHAYVRKLQALSCLMQQAPSRDDWLHALDRPVPRLQAIAVPDNVRDIATWARHNGQDAAYLQRLNPAHIGGRLSHIQGRPAHLLAVAPVASPSATRTMGDAGELTTAAAITATTSMDAAGVRKEEATSQTAPQTAEAARAESASPRRHTVSRGESASKIAARYGVDLADLLHRNRLTLRSVLRPGMVLSIDGDVTGGRTQAAGTP